MPSTFFGLSIGTSGLYAYQASINTTGHNISNVDTKGYSRQTTEQSASQAISVSSRYGMCGTGVDVTGITQERNVYYDEKYWKNSAVYGEYSSKEYYMTNITNYINEENSEGMSKYFSNFYTSLSSLSDSAGDGTVRNQVINNASSFATYVNSLYKDLQGLQEEANFDIKNTVDQINSISEQLVALNKQINTIEVTGDNANDLRDQRNLLIDDLSKLANVTVSETKVGDGIGVNQYIVRLDGKILVDGGIYHKLDCEPSDTKNNENDVNGLYNIVWDNGVKFNSTSSTLGGKLKAIFQVRDGNNQENFKGTASSNIAASNDIISIKGDSINDINKLNLPASDGVITVGNQTYEYSKFTAKIGSDGKLTFDFKLKTPLTSDVSGEAYIDKSVDYKGIPYYMSQLNEFVRTFSSAFNALHNQGEDLNGDKGLDFFNGTDKVDGTNLTLTEQYATDGTASFSSVTGKDATDGKYYASYYNLNAGNFGVTKAITSNPNKIACAEKHTEGVEDTVYLKKLIALQSDVSMFKQGTPDSFIQSFTGDVGTDAKTAQNFSKSQNNILSAIDKQRMAISGVDEDEETMSLVKFREAYNLSCKVISTMNAIYDKLINGLGV